MPARAKPDQRNPVDMSRTRPIPGSEEERKERQSDLLDAALLETFPASDPVSVAEVK